jgi:hypothetical protein
LRAPYLDVACDLIRLSEGAPPYRVVLSLADWGGSGGRLSMHADFATEDQALDDIASAIVLFRLRRVPGRDQWRNAPSPGFRRGMWRVEGRLRRMRAAKGIVDAAPALSGRTAEGRHG